MGKSWTRTSQSQHAAEKAKKNFIFVKNKEAVDRVQIWQYETLEEEKRVKVVLRVALDFESDDFTSTFFQGAGGCFMLYIHCRRYLDTALGASASTAAGNWITIWRNTECNFVGRGEGQGRAGVHGAEGSSEQVPPVVGYFRGYRSSVCAFIVSEYSK